MNHSHFHKTYARRNCLSLGLSLAARKPGFDEMRTLPQTYVITTYETTFLIFRFNFILRTTATIHGAQTINRKTCFGATVDLFYGLFDDDFSN